MNNHPPKVFIWIVRLCLLGEALVYGFGVLFIFGEIAF
jgi:hypothetical protein